MKEIKKLIAVFIAAIFFIGLFIICDRFAENVKDEYASQIDPSLRSSHLKRVILTAGPGISVDPSHQHGKLIEHNAQKVNKLSLP